MKLSWAAKWAIRQSLGKVRGESVIAIIEAIHPNDLERVKTALKAIGIRL